MILRSFVAVGMVALALSVSAAVAQTIDGATVESYERSVRAMADSLPEADKPVFAKGMMNMIVTGYPASAGVEGLALLSLMPAAVEAAHITLDGVTVDCRLELTRGCH